MTKTSAKIEITEFHWMMDMLQSMDVGLMVIDRKYNVQVWNDFMANNSGMPPRDIIEKNILSVFDDLPEAWFKRKADPPLPELTATTFLPALSYISPAEEIVKRCPFVVSSIFFRLSACYARIKL